MINFNKILNYLKQQKPFKRNLIIYSATFFMILLIVPPLSNILKNILSREVTTEKTESEMIEELIQNEDLSKIEYVTPEIEKETEYKQDGENKFNKYNKIEFSDIKIQDDSIKLKATNKGDKTIYGLSILLFNDENKQIISFDLDINDELKSNETTHIDFDYTGSYKNLEVKEYSYYIKNKENFNSVYIDLKDKTASYILGESREDLD